MSGIPDIDPFPRVGVVLLRPKSPGNVGSVARAMKNMGFSRLIVANPIAYDEPGYFDVEARRMAWQAEDLLESRLEAPDLAAALAPFTWVAGTTSNPPDGARVLAPRELAAELAGHLTENPTGSAVLLFGQEDIGLTRQDLSHCHRVGAIPSADVYPSLNLSQAALLFLYETRLALGLPRAAAAPQDDADGAPEHGQLEAFYRRLEDTLDAIGFFQGTARAHMMRELRRLFNRTLLTRRELSILEGIVHQVMWAGRRRG